MRNLRKLTAVVLAVALVLTSMAAAFAATEESTTAATVTVVNGDKAAVLKELKLYAGTDDTNPAAGLEAALKVQDALIWLATEFGYKAEADKLTDEDATKALAKFADAKDISDYAKKVVAYSAQEGIIAGEKDKAGKLYVRPAASVTAARFATFMLKGLGYDLTGSFTEAVAQLSEVEGAKIDAESTGDLTRDAAVGFMYGVLTAKTDAGKTVAENLLAADSSLQTVLSKNSLLPVNGTLAVDTVVAIANNKLAVTLKEAANAAAADFSIVKKGTTTAVAVKDAVKESDKVYVLETDALTGGASYTLTVNGVATNFTGIGADTTTPTVKNVTGKDYNKFEIEFSDRMDYATATDIANYTFNKDIKVTSASLDSGRTKVTLITDVAKKNVVYSLTIQNVKNSDGKVVSKTTRTVTANEDKTAPKVSLHKVQNNRMIVVTFNEGMDNTALETASNYSINDLEIESVKGYDRVGDDGKYDEVVITTATQETNKAYTLTISNLTDAAVLKNALGTTTRTFRGAATDTSAPTVNLSKPVRSFNNNTVKIYFSDNNAMDVASLEDVSNYTIKDNSGSELDVISAKAMSTSYPDAYNADNKGVILTTSQQIVDPAKINYTVEVKGVQDEFGNALKPVSGSTYAKYNFMSSDIDDKAPFVEKVEFVSSTQVKFTFNEELLKSTAIDPTNYVFDNDLGAAIKAELSSNRLTVTLTTQEQTGNKKYTVTMNNLQDDYGNVVADAKAAFISTSGTLDVTAPSVSYIYAMNRSEVYVNLSESVSASPANIAFGVLNTDGTMSATVKNFARSGKIDDGKTIVYKAASTSDYLTSDNYQIKATTNGQFTDSADNKMTAITVATAAVPTGYTFAGNTIENTPPSVDYVEQIDAKTLRVYFTEPVAPGTFTNPGFYKVDSDSSDTHFTSVNYSTGAVFSTTGTVSIPVTQLSDLSGTPLAAAYNSFTPYLQDNAKPVITGVYADDNKTIFVLYDEKVPVSGTYKIYYLNSSNNPVYIYNGSGVYEEDSNKVPAIKISLSSTSVEASKIYYLEPVAGAVDVAGNRADVAGVKVEFPGTNKVTSGFITGVEINNATTITVGVTGKTINSISVFEQTANSPYSNLVNMNATLYPGKAWSDGKVSLGAPLLSGHKYRVTVGFVGTATTEDYLFDGNTPDMGVRLTTVAGETDTVRLDFAAFDTKPYVFKAIAGVTTSGGITAGAIVNATVLDPNATTDNGTDDIVKFIGTGTDFALNNEVYVILYDSEDITRVVYSAKVIVTAP